METNSARHPTADSRTRVRYSSLSLEVDRSCVLYLLQFSTICNLGQTAATRTLQLVRNPLFSSQI